MFEACLCNVLFLCVYRIWSESYWTFFSPHVFHYYWFEKSNVIIGYNLAEHKLEDLLSTAKLLYTLCHFKFFHHARITFPEVVCTIKRPLLSFFNL